MMPPAARLVFPDNLSSQKVLRSVKTEHVKQIKFDICFINRNKHLQPQAATKEEKSKTEVLTYEL